MFFRIASQDRAVVVSVQFWFSCAIEVCRILLAEGCAVKTLLRRWSLGRRLVSRLLVGKVARIVAGSHSVGYGDWAVRDPGELKSLLVFYAS